MTAERKELFISYGREPEVIQFVHRLKGDLENNGFSVWLDAHDIPAGSDWHGAIGAGLNRCKAIVPILTNKYVGSRYCVNELYTADGDKKLIFPVMFEDIDFDASESGHGVKFVISSVNWTMCRPGVDDYNDSVSKLIAGMKAKGLGTGAREDDDGQEGGSSSLSHHPPPAPPKPVVGPASIRPFKVIPDVENPEGIASTQDGQLIVSIIRQKVLIFNSNHEKILEMGGDPGLGMGQFLNPNGVVVDSNGHILVAGHYFIQRFTSSGKFLQQAGGTDPSGFSIDSPRGMAIGKEGRIYIAEQQKHRVTILNRDLSLHKRFRDADRMLGSGHLNMPQGVAINSEGTVYVADMMNHVIQVFDPEGVFLFRFGKMGHGPGTTTSPSAITIDKEDYVYVGTGASTVSIFDPRGNFVRAFGEYGSEVGKFNQIRALHIDKDGVLYVGEWTSNRIQMFKTGLQEGVDARGEGDHGGTLKVTDQLRGMAIQPPTLPQQQASGLNVTGEGRGVVVMGGKGGVVSIGPNVVFRGQVAIQPGATVLTQQGAISSPVAISSGGRGQMSEGGQVGGVIFAKSASAPCQQAGLNQPVHVLEVKGPHTIAVAGSGEIVVVEKSSGLVKIFSSDYKQLLEKEVRDLRYCCLVIGGDNVITAVTSTGFIQMDMHLNELRKVPSRKVPGLESIRTPYGMALGEKGRLYIAGVKKSHIVNDDFSYYRSFAEGFQSFGIAVSSHGNVYLPVLSENTIHVFSPDGDSLFCFGGPGHAPLPQLSLQSPMNLALDCHDNVYVGTGMKCVNVFDKEGKFLEAFGTQGSKLGQFENAPSAIFIDHNQFLYVGEQGTDRIQIFKLTTED